MAGGHHQLGRVGGVRRAEGLRLPRDAGIKFAVRRTHGELITVPCSRGAWPFPARRLCVGPRMKLPSASAGGTAPSGSSLAVTKPGVCGSRVGGPGTGRARGLPGLRRGCGRGRVGPVAPTPAGRRPAKSTPRQAARTQGSFSSCSFHILSTRGKSRSPRPNNHWLGQLMTTNRGFDHRNISPASPRGKEKNQGRGKAKLQISKSKIQGNSNIQISKPLRDAGTPGKDELQNRGASPWRQASRLPQSRASRPAEETHTDPRGLKKGRVRLKSRLQPGGKICILYASMGFICNDRDGAAWFVPHPAERDAVRPPPQKRRLRPGSAAGRAGGSRALSIKVGTSFCRRVLASWRCRGTVTVLCAGMTNDVTDLPPQWNCEPRDTNPPGHRNGAAGGVPYAGLGLPVAVRRPNRTWHRDPRP